MGLYRTVEMPNYLYRGWQQNWNNGADVTERNLPSSASTQGKGVSKRGLGASQSTGADREKSSSKMFQVEDSQTN